MGVLVPVVNLANVKNVDFLVGPKSTDMSLALGLARAGALALAESRAVAVELKPGIGGNYTFDELDIPPNVFLRSPSQEVVTLDGQFNFTGAGRRELRNITMRQSADKNCLNIEPSGFSVVLLRNGSYQSSAGAGAKSVVETKVNGILLASGTEFLTQGGNPNAVLLQTAGAMSMQNNFLISQFDFNTPAIEIVAGVMNLARGLVQGPVDINGGALVAEVATIDAFQLSGLSGTAVTLSNGAVAVLRSMAILQADGQNNPVFDDGGGGGGSVFHDQMNVEHFEFTGAGTLFDAGIAVTQLKERAGTPI